jgi:hypothetical protein
VVPVDEAESDSEPSCDNFDQQEQKQIFSEALSEEDIQEIFAEDIPAVSDRLNAEPSNIGGYANNNGDLNVVIEQVSEQDELFETQGSARPDPGDPLEQVNQDADTERLRDKINSL